MITRIRNSAFTKFLWALMGLYFLNISVDNADPHPEHIPEDLSVNHQESIIEIIIEKILGFEDAFKEYDDHDTEDHANKTNTKTDLIAQGVPGPGISHLFAESKKQKFPPYKAHLTNGFQQLDVPPPKS